jgi:hypothetical protein
MSPLLLYSLREMPTALQPCRFEDPYNKLIRQATYVVQRLDTVEIPRG